VLPFILFTINWQIAMPSIGRSSLFYSRKSVGSGIIFILLLSVLNHFEILKWQNLVSFYIKSQSRGNKTSPRCLDGWTIYSKWYWEYAGKPCSLINQLPKSVVFKLDLQWNQMILTVILGFWFAVF
jgi:hypothetical protein